MSPVIEHLYRLRSLGDDELAELVRRLEQQVRDMAEARTPLARKLAEEYRAQLCAARLEHERRNHD
jgi:hypothetical protein